MDKTTLEKSALNTKAILGSINLSDIEILQNEGLDGEEYYARASSCELFYKRYFEKVLKLLIQKQLEEIATKALNEGQMVFGRGTINGFFLIQDWFKEQISISMERFNKDKEPEKGELPIQQI